MRKEIASRDNELASQKRKIEELSHKANEAERQLKQQRVINASREKAAGKATHEAWLRAQLGAEKELVKKLEAEKDELVSKVKTEKLQAELELEIALEKAAQALDVAKEANDSKEEWKQDSTDSERRAAEMERELEEQIRLTEESRGEAEALQHALGSAKERLRELSLEQSQGEDPQVPMDMSEEYQTQEGSDDSGMETDITEAAEKAKLKYAEAVEKK